jgi:uncharacterized linocin/CFP29 family protein
MPAAYLIIQGEKYIVIVTANDPYGFKELEQLKRVLLIILWYLLCLLI